MPPATLTDSLLPGDKSLHLVIPCPSEMWKQMLFKVTVFLHAALINTAVFICYLFQGPWQGTAAKLYLDTSSTGDQMCAGIVIYAKGKETPGHQV